MAHLLSGVFWEAQKSAHMQKKKKEKEKGKRDHLTAVEVIIIINNLFRAFSAGIQRRFILEVIQILKRMKN